MARKKRPAPSKKKVSERRGHSRHPVEGVSGSFLFSTEGKILNLSLDGMALETSDYLQLGRSYTLKLVRDDEELVLQGRVVWCRMVGTARKEGGDVGPVYSAGVEFEELLGEAASEVQRFLGSNAVISLEKRLFGRFRLHDSDTANVDYEASYRVEKISRNGMQISSDTFVEPEVVLDLELRIGRRSITTTGRVVHGRRLDPQPGVDAASRLGIEFVDMTEKAKTAIETLIQKAIK
jgi:Tfp pilus assembly protein PilZ